MLGSENVYGFLETKMLKSTISVNGDNILLSMACAFLLHAMMPNLDYIFTLIVGDSCSNQSDNEGTTCNYH